MTEAVYSFNEWGIAVVEESEDVIMGYIECVRCTQIY